MRNTAPWWLAFAVRLRFTRSATIALVGLALAVAGLSAGLHLSAASLLSTSQMDQRDFGRYTQSLSVSLGACHPSAQCPLEKEVPQLVKESGGTQSQALRALIGLKLDRTKANVGLLEGSWNSTTFPQAYRLVAGRWPTRASEVAVPQSWHLKPGTELSTYAQAHSLTVVGAVAAIYDDNDQTMLAAQGTSSAIYGALTAHAGRYRLPESVMTIRTSGANVQALEQRVSHAVAQMSQADEKAVYAGIKGTTMHTQPGADGWPDYLKRLPVVAGWLPLLTIPLLFSLMSSFTGLSSFTRGKRIAHAVGVPTRGLAMSAAGVWCLATCVVASASVIAGWAVAQALRSWFRSTTSRPLSDSPELAWLLLAVLLMVMLGWLIQVAVSGVQALRATLGGAMVRWGGLLRLFSRVLGYVGLFLISANVVGSFVTASLGNEKQMMRWIILSCLLIAVCTSYILTAWRDSNARMPLPVTLALRKIRTTRTSSVLLMSVVTLAVALPLSAGITMATAQYRSNLTRVSNVPQGQVVLGMNFSESGGLPPHIRFAFERYTGLSNPVLTRQAKVFTTGDLMQGLPYVMDSVSDVERFIGHPLTPAQAKAFTSGGILVPAFTGNVIKQGQVIATTTPQGKPTQSLKATLLQDVPESYHIGNLGFISARTAQEAGWRTDNGYATYTDVSGPQLSAALHAASALKFDPRSVAAYDVPPPLAMPPALSLAQRLLTGALALIVFCVTLRYLAQVQPYAATLHTVGVGRRTLTLMVGVLVTVTVVLPLIIGHVVAVLVNQVGWRRAIHDNYGAMVPWGDVRASLVMSLAVAFLAVVLALAWRAVRARFRLKKRSQNLVQ